MRAFSCLGALAEKEVRSQAEVFSAAEGVTCGDFPFAAEDHRSKGQGFSENAEKADTAEILLGGEVLEELEWLGLRGRALAALEH